MITIPDTSKNPDAGLVFSKGKCYASWTEDKRRCRRLLHSPVTEKPLLRKERDAFYDKLLELKDSKVAARRGPRLVKTGDRKRRAEEDPMKYIGFNEKVTSAPWFVRIDGRIIGRRETEDKARKLRNAHLGIK